MIARFRSKNIADASRRLMVVTSSVAVLNILVSGATLDSAQIGDAKQGAQAKQPAPQSAPQSTNGSAKPPGTPGTTPAAAVAVPPPPDYIIGADDVLSIMYWREKDLTTEVVVRPDGKISLPLLNDVQAAGLTPTQLREHLTEEARRFVEDPNVTVVVNEIHSRNVYITGEVGKPGPYPLTGPMTVLQLISVAGGLGTYADAKKIVIVRTENGRQVTLPFNYHDVATRKSLKQNILLKPGDTVIVP